MILLIDNYDSFTYNLVDYFQQLGCSVKVVRNDEPIDANLISSCKGIVLSPGPENPLKAGNLMGIVKNYLGIVPMLGICLGHQAIALHLGGELNKAERPMHGKISRIALKESPIFENLPPNIEVVRYHSLVVTDWNSKLLGTAFAENGELMAFDAEENVMAHGLQFHPEAALTQYGLEVLRNWLTFYNIV